MPLVFFHRGFLSSRGFFKQDSFSAEQNNLIFRIGNGKKLENSVKLDRIRQLIDCKIAILFKKQLI